MKLANSNFSKGLSQVYDRITTQDYYHMFANSVIHYVQQELDLDGSSVFDVGCGNGDLTAALSKLGASNVLGIDVSDAQIEIARRKHQHHHIEFIVGDAYTLTQQELGPFDLVTCMYSFHFIPNEKVLFEAFKNIYINLKPGGTLVFLDITHDYLYNKKAMKQLQEWTSYHYEPDVKEGEKPELWSVVPGFVKVDQELLKVDHIAIHGEVIKKTMQKLGFSKIERKPLISRNKEIVEFWGPDHFNHHLFVAKK